MSQFDIQGRNALFQTDVLGDMLDLVCVKSFSINVGVDPKEITTDGNGLWKDYDYDRLGFTITLTGLVQIFGESDKPTFYDLYDAMVNFLEVGFRILFVDDSDNPAIITGQCIVNNKLFDASPGKLLNGSVTLLGKGELLTFKPSETNTFTFMVNNVDFTADNQLTATQNDYKINDFTIMSTSSATSQQNLRITYRLPKLGGTVFGDDYLGPTTTGILNLGVVAPPLDTGTHWLVSYEFDYVAATANKSFNEQLAP
jgi:hypothetical protein